MHDPLADLTLRLRHPVRWTLRHPVQAVTRSESVYRVIFWACLVISAGVLGWIFWNAFPYSAF